MLTGGRLTSKLRKSQPKFGGGQRPELRDGGSAARHYHTLLSLLWRNLFMANEHYPFMVLMLLSSNLGTLLALPCCAVVHGRGTQNMSAEDHQRLAELYRQRAKDEALEGFAASLLIEVAEDHEALAEALAACASTTGQQQPSGNVLGNEVQNPLAQPSP